MPTPSGKQWVNLFPTSNSLSTLKGSFASAAKNFVAALQAAKAHVEISATYRPPQRAYLMHWAWAIAHGHDPSKVPAMSGVDIAWVHKDKSGKIDLPASKKAAQEMMHAYKMAYHAALVSRHTQGLAVDMEITWSGELKITDGNKKLVIIKSSPRDNGNKDLHAVAKTYKVYKLVSDFPHWSSDGH